MRRLLRWLLTPYRVWEKAVDEVIAKTMEAEEPLRSMLLHQILYGEDNEVR